MKEEIEKFFKGEVEDNPAILEKYSKDASLFEVRPKLVVYPKDAKDLSELVRYISQKREGGDEQVSLSIRAAGSGMSGGSLNDSIVADVTRYMKIIGEFERSDLKHDSQGPTSVWAEPGVFYRDFEKKTHEKGVEFPAYPASKDLCAIGGMVANNCAGEKTLRYGKMEDLLLETKVIFSDGKEYEVKPLNKSELEKKTAQEDFEGNLYKNIYSLIRTNKRIIDEAKPRVSKNSAGYFLWNVWDEGKEIFDLNKLIVGSQGTLGLVTEAKLKLVPVKEHHDLVAIFFKSWDELPKVVNALLPLEPEGLEVFDAETLKLGLRFLPEIAKKAGTGLASFALKFLPEALIGVRMLGLPKLVVLVEFAEESPEAVREKTRRAEQALAGLKVWHRTIDDDKEEEKFWIMRRESFSLLRKHVSGKRTVPLIDDFCITPEKMPEFLPRAKSILEDAGIKVNIAGHAGNGNYHIIPLMDMRDEKERAKLPGVADKIYDLVGEFGGSITAEHNDGIVRTPYLGKMYKPEILELFKQTKQIFDPLNIFNPGKKVPSGEKGTVAYMSSHIAVEG